MSVVPVSRPVWMFVIAVGLMAGSAGPHHAAATVAAPSTGETTSGLLTDDQRRAYARAMKAARTGDLFEAYRLSPAIRDPLADRLVSWTAFRAGGNDAEFEAIRRFTAAHPDWPSQRLLRRRAEEAIDDTVDAAVVLAWFAQHPPTTGHGRIRYAQALFAARRPGEGAIWLKRGWPTARLSVAKERRVLTSHAGLLSATDHLARADHFLWQRDWRTASRLLDRVPAERRTLIRARIGLVAFTPDVDARVRAVPEAQKSDPGLIYDRVFWRRIKGKHVGARDLLLAEDVTHGIRRPDRWWRERHLQARRALRQGDLRAAYELAGRHGLLADDGEEPAVIARAQIVDAEWLAGWIALRFLNTPAAALDHFTTMYGIATLPLSQSRAAYWAGRAASAMGETAMAEGWFDRAAEFPQSFYGQLALEQRGRALALMATPLGRPTPDDRAAFATRELVRAAHLLAEMDARRELRVLMRHLSAAAPGPEEQRLVAELGDALERPDMSLIAARIAARTGTLFFDHGYPVIAVPDGHLDRLPMILAITRQESAFDQTAVSRAGALGLMQLMPPTAQLMARRLSLPFSRDRLLDDPQYNLTLGSTHFAELLDDYAGSHVLALAAYNAGSRPVSRWLQFYGDPRAADADPIDWIESIPYGETRNYVQRVLEAATVYSQRLDSDAAMPLSKFLTAGRKPPRR